MIVRQTKCNTHVIKNDKCLNLTYAFPNVDIMSLPKSPCSDEDHPEVPQTEGGRIDDHPHQGHQIDRQGRLPGRHKRNNIQDLLEQSDVPRQKTASGAIGQYLNGNIQK